MRHPIVLACVIAALLFCNLKAYAQPANDNPCGAIELPVFESADVCMPSRVSFNGATYTAYQINGGISCSRSFANDPDVWYKFTATNTELKVAIAPAAGSNPGCNINYSVSAAEFLVLSGNCSGPFTYVSCGRSDMSSTLTLTNLVVGSEYYIKISTGFGYTCGTLGACVYTGVPPASAKVGINTTLPTTNFDVAGQATFRNNVTFNSDLAVSKLVSPNLTITGNIASVQNVSVAGALSVAGNAGITGAVTSGSVSTGSISMTNQLGNRLALYGGLGNAAQFGFGIQNSLFQIYADATNSNIAFGYGNSSNFTERARIINNGELAFQTNGRLQLRTGSQTAGLWLANAANSANVGFIGVPNDNAMGFFGNTGGGWGLTMNANNGFVGIGLNGASAQVPLQFSNTLGLTKISLYRGAYGDVGLGAYGGELRLQNDIPNGKVSMGVLETTGTFTELAKAQRSGAFAFSIFGSLWANGTTYASDGRFKKNIEPLQQSLDKVLQLQGVSYQMKAEAFPKENFDTATQVGLVAQEVEKIVPEVVSEGPNGYKAIDYAKLVPLLIEAIKSQQQQIDELKRLAKPVKKKRSAR